jgi:trk system potassium uptake protein TrkA
VFILGGGKISYYLAKELLDSFITVKIVENNMQRAEELSKSLPRATILFFDANDQENLEEEKLQNSDACVALTGMDEENVIISLYAKSKGVQKIVTKVDKTSMGNMVSKLGLDTVVSPRDIIANDIVRFVRAHQSRDTDNINALYKLYDIAEALEFSVDENFTSANIPLKDLPIKDNVLIGGIVRNGEFILPEGKTVIKNNDKVIILTIDKQITELNQIIK